MDDKLFNRSPREYSFQLADEEIVSIDLLLEACLKYMSEDQIRDMLEQNELSPRLLNDADFNEHNLLRYVEEPGYQGA